MNRRAFLAASLSAGCAGEDVDPAPAPAPACPLDAGELLGEVPFLDGGVPFHEKVGVGWDARLFFDLRALERDRLVVDNERFYIRTELPDQLDLAAPWSLRAHGLLAAERTLTLADLAPLVQPQGVLLLECSGNADGGAFGLMSAAEWSGAPLADVLALLPVLPAATRVLVSGFDGHSTPSENGHSQPGASWIFTLDELVAAGAFLATEMNGVALPPDHGAPVRLFVPGWYGCCCIKWVDEIELVDDDAAATGQMREFASRTHQPGTPELARDYLPATMDQAAMPVRVERRRRADGLAYRVTGILWGGHEVTDALRISFDGGQRYEPVAVCPAPEDNRTWTLWDHLWRPAAPGVHLIHMAIADAAIPTRRLDLGWYDRAVEIVEVG